MGFDKLTVPLAGQPLLSHTLRAFEECAAVTGILLVCDSLREGEFHQLVEKSRIKKLIGFAPSGKERRDSVWNGILAAGKSVDYLAVHDGARPLVTPGLIANCIQAAMHSGAACAAERVADTHHRADAKNLLIETVSREGLWRMQTPQVFHRDDLHAAYLHLIQVGGTATDEASVFLRTGRRVFIEEAVDWNFKVTVPRDLALAEIILTNRKQS